MKHSSLGGDIYVTFVDDYTRFKEVVRFAKNKNDVTAALTSLIAYCITPQELFIECIWTDNGGEFEGECQRELDRRGITHKHTPPDMSHYNGVAERAFGLIHEEGVTLLEKLADGINAPKRTFGGSGDVIRVRRHQVRHDIKQGGKSPCEFWFEPPRALTIDCLRW